MRTTDRGTHVFAHGMAVIEAAKDKWWVSRQTDGVREEWGPYTTLEVRCLVTRDDWDARLSLSDVRNSRLCDRLEETEELLRVSDARVAKIAAERNMVRQKSEDHRTKTDEILKTLVKLTVSLIRERDFARATAKAFRQEVPRCATDPEGCILPWHDDDDDLLNKTLETLR